MILKFPDLNSLRLALITGAVPSGVARASAVAGLDDQNHCWVEADGSLARGNQAELKKLGVQIPRAFGAPLRNEVSCWAEILPLERDRQATDHLEQTPVLFEMVNGEELSRLVIEILRLGNDRQSYRWLEEDGGEGSSKALLRVVGPPYYSLLRAMDRIGGPLAPVAFLERSPRVWVEIGYSHPLVGQIKPPQGKILMLRVHERAPLPDAQEIPLPCPRETPPPNPLPEAERGRKKSVVISREQGASVLLPPLRFGEGGWGGGVASGWTVLQDVPYRDIYEALEFELPDAKSVWKEAKLNKQIEVTLSLKPGGSTDGAELWVLRDNPVEALNRFVQNADDQILQRLAFAVGQKGGETSIVVRVRQSKQPPPVLVFSKAIAYKHYLKLPNLFLPAGTRLHPPLRRDQVRKLLADDTDSVVWLHPGEKGGFVPESLSEDSFRPLWDWIDYVLDHEKESLQAWVQAAQFDFEPFICDDDPSTKPRKPPGEGKPRPSRDRKSSRDGGGDANFVPPLDEPPKPDEASRPIDEFSSVVKVEPSVLQKTLREREESFLAIDGGLDARERQEMWPQLASLNAQLKNVDDAGVCWMNALWERDERAARAWSWDWFAIEASEVPERRETSRSAPRKWVTRVLLTGAENREVSGGDLDLLLNAKEPATADLRALAAYVTYAALRDPPSQALVSRLGQVSRFLEANEKLLPVRAVWLAWSHLAMLSSGDVLALARARDRLLERLYHEGLRPEKDLPSFLRFDGQPTTQRFRAVRQWMIDLVGLAQEWIKKLGSLVPTAQTPAYVDLMFAFGLARLGESDAARNLLASARKVLGDLDDAHNVLCTAFEYRIKQALDGKPHTGPLLNEQIEYLEHMEKLQRYVVDRMRRLSRILEPEQRIDPYLNWTKKVSPLEEALAALIDLTDRVEIAARVEKLLLELPKSVKGNEQRARVLRAGLEAAPRVGEEFARKMLEQTIPAYDALPETKELHALMEQAAFLEKALFVAGHFGRIEKVEPLVTRFQRMLQGQRGPQALKVLDSLAAQCLRGLRKLGMRDEIDQILRQMADLVLEGKEVKEIDFKKRDHRGPELRALLQVAAGWHYFGRDSQAEPILQAARGVLLSGVDPLLAREQTALACAYASAVGQAPVELAQKLLGEIFLQFEGIKDGYTTSAHFSVSQLDVVESVVLAVVSDDFTLGTQARRWLDDDEFLVRRRIHRDLRKVMDKG